MRKISKDAVNAFSVQKNLSSSNTMVKYDPVLEETYLYLHGNLIAKNSPKEGLRITSAGWETNTTKERLNALPGVSINQKKGVWYLNGVEWDGSWINVHELNSKC